MGAIACRCSAGELRRQRLGFAEDHPASRGGGTESGLEAIPSASPRAPAPRSLLGRQAHTGFLRPQFALSLPPLGPGSAPCACEMLRLRCRRSGPSNNHARPPCGQRTRWHDTPGAPNVSAGGLRWGVSVLRARVCALLHPCAGAACGVLCTCAREKEEEAEVEGGRGPTAPASSVCNGRKGSVYPALCTDTASL